MAAERNLTARVTFLWLSQHFETPYGARRGRGMDDVTPFFFPFLGFWLSSMTLVLFLG